MAQTPLRFGTHLDFAPFSYFGDGVAHGLVVERIEAALADGVWRIDWMPLGLPDQWPALERGDVDLLVGIGGSDERAARMDLSQPIVTTGGAGFARAGDQRADPDAGPAAWGAAGLRVVSPAAGPLLAPLAAVPGLRTGDGVDYATSLAMVLAGQADLAALNFHVGREMAAREHPGRFRLPTRPYREIPLVAAALKGRQGDVLAAINAGLRRLPRG